MECRKKQKYEVVQFKDTFVSLCEIVDLLEEENLPLYVDYSNKEASVLKFKRNNAECSVKLNDYIVKEKDGNTICMTYSPQQFHELFEMI